SAGVIFSYNRKFGVAAMVLAVLMGFSRLYLYVHYPSDVLTGMLLGLAAAWLSVWIGKRFMTEDIRTNN
ncbi:MAG: phosphatase PAP2 family protein, partial [Oscillospiraceae bacterium]